eukprot:scaffold34926_cov48-Phaeocystis_antarctica.AAC.2
MRGWGRTERAGPGERAEMARHACGLPPAEHWRRRCRVAQGHRVAGSQGGVAGDRGVAAHIAQASRLGRGGVALTGRHA